MLAPEVLGRNGARRLLRERGFGPVSNSSGPMAASVMLGCGLLPLRDGRGTERHKPLARAEPVARVQLHNVVAVLGGLALVRPWAASALPLAARVVEFHRFADLSPRSELLLSSGRARVYLANWLYFVSIRKGTCG
jgi:hypothetical protein